MSVLYLDSSAITKLVLAEAGSAEARAEVRDSTIVSSRVAVVEVTKAVTRVAPEAAVAETLEALVFIELDEELAHEAAIVGGASLRALDAIHIASAALIGDELDGFLTYDARQAAAAKAAGMVVLSPGTPPLD